MNASRSRLIVAMALVQSSAVAAAAGWVAEPGVQSRLASGEVVVGHAGFSP